MDRLRSAEALREHGGAMNPEQVRYHVRNATGDADLADLRAAERALRDAARGP